MARTGRGLFQGTVGVEAGVRTGHRTNISQKRYYTAELPPPYPSLYNQPTVGSEAENVILCPPPPRSPHGDVTRVCSNGRMMFSTGKPNCRSEKPVSNWPRTSARYKCVMFSPPPSTPNSLLLRNNLNPNSRTCLCLSASDDILQPYKTTGKTRTLFVVHVTTQLLGVRSPEEWIWGRGAVPQFKALLPEGVRETHEETPSGQPVS
jgi:hypothetical protein